MQITSQQLKDSVRCSQSNADKYLSAINATMAKYQIDTPLRAAHYLAQIGHESMGFIYTRELASGEGYEGRIDLGNTHAGDGIKYKGRGFLQVTGRDNYKAYGDYVGLDFINSPHLLEMLPYSVDSSGWFWSIYKNLNLIADKDNVILITKRINGGTTGLSDRKARLIYCKKALGIQISPSSITKP